MERNHHKLFTIQKEILMIVNDSYSIKICARDQFGDWYEERIIPFVNDKSIVEKIIEIWDMSNGDDTRIISPLCFMTNYNAELYYEIIDTIHNFNDNYEAIGDYMKNNFPLYDRNVLIIIALMQNNIEDKLGDEMTCKPQIITEKQFIL